MFFDQIFGQREKDGYVNVPKENMRLKVQIQQGPRPINIKDWLKALEGLEDDDAIFLAKADIVKLLQDLRAARQKNSQLATKVARLRRESVLTND